MARSVEYPDLPFVPPRSFGRGRDGKGVRLIVVHYTAGAERSTSAEDGAAYDQRRTDGTSTHYFVDSNSVVQCVLTADRANAAFGKGNRLGIQYELCGTVQTRAQWLDAASDATLTNAARQIARDCRRYGIPVRRLSTAETRAAWYQFPNGPRGIVGHVDVTNAFPEDGGTHTDPGPQFPWDVLLARVQQFLGRTESTSTERTHLMYMVQATGDPSVYVSDGMRRRHVDWDTYLVLRDIVRAPHVMVPSQEALDRRGGPLDSQTVPVELTAGQLAEIAAAAERGAGGPSLDDIRGVVDGELDEQARAGADDDG